MINLDTPNDELAYHIRIRALSFREWIHRPFLYYIVHHSLEDRYYTQVMPLAMRCLELSTNLILESQSHHRHHGTWNTARTSLTRALLLLAAARSRRIELPSRWREAIDMSVMRLQRWGEEASDLQRGATVLEGVARDTYEVLSLGDTLSATVG